MARIKMDCNSNNEGFPIKQNEKTFSSLLAYWMQSGVRFNLHNAICYSLSTIRLNFLLQHVRLTINIMSRGGMQTLFSF